MTECTICYLPWMCGIYLFSVADRSSVLCLHVTTADLGGGARSPELRGVFRVQPWRHDKSEGTLRRSQHKWKAKWGGLPSCHHISLGFILIVSRLLSALASVRLPAGAGATDKELRRLEIIENPKKTRANLITAGNRWIVPIIEGIWLWHEVK